MTLEVRGLEKLYRCIRAHSTIMMYYKYIQKRTQAGTEDDFFVHKLHKNVQHNYINTCTRTHLAHSHYTALCNVDST